MSPDGNLLHSIKQLQIILCLASHSIACMGGDGTVSQLVDALMNRAQKERGVDVKTGAPAAASPVPLGIIPTG